MSPFLPIDLSRPIAVAVSGGADSLCLTFLLHDWVSSLGGRIIALTVDHQLRPESTAEAHQVKSWLSSQGIIHEILTWTGEKPTSRLQEKARDARYDLLESWCLNNDINHLATAHHADDQLETILQRLSRGSGITGLCGIPAKSSRRFGSIIRPLLSVSKTDLLDTLHSQNHPFVTDPSNSNTQFDRIKWRQATPLLATLGLTTDGILKSIHRLQQSENSLEDITTAHLHQSVTVSPLGYACISPCVWAEKWQDIRHRALGLLLRCIGGGKYISSYESICRLDDLLRQPSFKGKTLGGCYLFPHKKQIIVTKECRLTASPQPYKSGLFWDDRFLITGDFPYPVYGQTIGKNHAERLASPCKTHPAILTSLPAFYDSQGELVSIPHFPAQSLHEFQGNIHFAPRQGLTS